MINFKIDLLVIIKNVVRLKIWQTKNHVDNTILIALETAFQYRQKEKKLPH